MPAQIIDKLLHLEGFVYYRTRERNGRTYWECRRVRKKECTARAVTTVNAADGSIEVQRGPTESEHSHAPNVDENEAQILTSRIKRRAEDHPEERPAQMLRSELQNVEPEVLSQMPEQTALVRRIQRTRRKNMSANPIRWMTYRMFQLCTRRR